MSDERPNLNDKKAVDRFIERADPLLRPLLERQEAQSFLAKHHREYGFDLNKPENRAQLVGTLLGVIAGGEFIDFELTDLPDFIQRKIDHMVNGWQTDMEQCTTTHVAARLNASRALCHVCAGIAAEAEQINQDVETYYNIPTVLYASIDNDRKVWIRKR
jgi:hypothetical protein